MTWFLLGRADGEEINASLVPEFKYLSIIVICVGVIFTIIFHVGTKEAATTTIKKKCDIETSAASKNTKKEVKTWKEWLKDLKFYKTGLLYMCTRLTINIFQTFFVIYLTDGVHFDKVSKFCTVFRNEVNYVIAKVSIEKYLVYISDNFIKKIHLSCS